MEIKFDFSTIFVNKPVQRLDRGQLLRFNPRRYWAVEKAIDQLGEMSTKAQGLKRTLTSYNKILDQEEEHVLYIMWQNLEDTPNTSLLIGLLKVGNKRLYLTDRKQNQYEERPLCILDFYIAESEQRKGNGHELFEYMLKEENIEVDRIAIDRPSEAFLQFLNKYYELKDPVWQPTNFVVFPGFFEKHSPKVVNTPRGGARSEKFSACPRDVSPAPMIVNKGRARTDSAAGIIHNNETSAARRTADPDTPLGRKNTRDFGHQQIWGVGLFALDRSAARMDFYVDPRRTTLPPGTTPDTRLPYRIIGHVVRDENRGVTREQQEFYDRWNSVQPIQSGTLRAREPFQRGNRGTRGGNRGFQQNSPIRRDRLPEPLTGNGEASQPSSSRGSSGYVHSGNWETRGRCRRFQLGPPFRRGRGFSGYRERSSDRFPEPLTGNGEASQPLSSRGSSGYVHSGNQETRGRGRRFQLGPPFRRGRRFPGYRGWFSDRLLDPSTANREASQSSSIRGSSRYVNSGNRETRGRGRIYQQCPPFRLARLPEPPTGNGEASQPSSSSRTTRGNPVQGTLTERNESAVSAVNEFRPTPGEPCLLLDFDLISFED
ncbi:unnamed protein product [Caenorhabditis auriculariae]|uniref:Alpha-tubulin N-acetyltransferase n=1 Tax=Caenorhabditis auriculariae TaxID=2777116 RepID=A0A8S1HIN3_9PELO|nr:unnamed protein product [Caenorhabditis auriculariae]